MVLSLVHLFLAAPLLHTTPAEYQAYRVEQQMYSGRFVEYFLVQGDHEVSRSTHVDRYRPTTDSGLTVEIGIKRPDGSTEVRLVAVAAAGEVFAASGGSLMIDYLARGRIQIEESPRHGVVSSTGSIACDGIYSGVESVSLPGGCWGPMTFNPETGAWTKPCNKDNSKKCKATVTFTSGGSSKKPVFSCSSDDGAMSGNASAGSAVATNTNDGTC